MQLTAPVNPVQTTAPTKLTPELGCENFWHSSPLHRVQLNICGRDAVDGVVEPDGVAFSQKQFVPQQPSPGTPTDLAQPLSSTASCAFTFSICRSASVLGVHSVEPGPGVISAQPGWIPFSAHHCDEASPQLWQYPPHTDGTDWSVKMMVQMAGTSRPSRPATHCPFPVLPLFPCPGGWPVMRPGSQYGIASVHPGNNEPLHV